MKKYLSILMLLLLAFGVSHAENVSLSGSTMIVGKTCKSTDYLVSPDNLQEATNGIIKAINVNTRNDQIENQKTIEVITKMTDYLSSSNKTQLEQFGAAQQRAQAEQEFGVGRRLESDCESPTIGGSALKGDIDQRRLVVYNDQVMQQYNRSAQNTATAVINAETALVERRKLLEEMAADSAAAESPPLPADLLFPREGSIPDDPRYQDASAAYIAMLTNPFPDPDFPKEVLDEIKSKPAELRKYHLFRSLKDDRLSLSQRFLSEIEAGNTATIPTEGWGDSLWQEMGGTGEMPGKIDGKISEMRLFDMLTNARFANENYLVAINENNSTGLLQRLLQIEIVNSRMMYEMLDTQKKLLGLMAMQNSDSARGEHEQMLIKLRQMLGAKSNVSE